MALGAGEIFQTLDFWGAIWCLPPALKRRLVEVGADVVIIGYNSNKQTKKLEIGKKYILQKQTTMHHTRASNIKLRQMCRVVVKTTNCTKKYLTKNCHVVSNRENQDSFCKKKYFTEKNDMLSLIRQIQHWHFSILIIALYWNLQGISLQIRISKEDKLSGQLKYNDRIIIITWKKRNKSKKEEASTAKCCQLNEIGKDATEVRGKNIKNYFYLGSNTVSYTHLTLPTIYSV